ncbi:O-acetyl-ADP-ribose deacetylase [Vibrio ponticus]|uniref:O-acetyl-ADP-ribose deacetylase n=1 Tax=Vibrio ponticus TaxID=265668 RepID=A0ABX3FQP2_9VIBR|nr:macro domain-containing protein [Vibrio ponticus]OLQ95332.1 O-acetyl-ADP-ribose deacetylase [Vibrio ponticus]
MSNIYIVSQDITTANVDAIVNAANPRLLGGGGVDGAIHRAAGSELLKACFAIEELNGKRCGYGDARITPAGNLKARYVIHAVGPIYANFSDPKAVLESAYQQALNLALQNNCITVALPAISCGVYGYPPHEAAEIAIKVCQRKEYKSLQMTFYLWGEDMLSIWQNELVKQR